MPSLEDTLAALMARPRTTMRVGTSTASPSAVSVAGGTVSVDRWIGAPSGAGEPVVLFMQDGAVVACVAGADSGYVKRSGDTMTGDLHVDGSGDTGIWVNGMPLHRRPRVVVTANGGSLPTTAATWTWTQGGLPSHEGVQTSAMWNGSGRFQAPWDGLYRLEGTIRCDAISGGYPARFGGEILRNGTRLQLWGYGAANGGAASVQYVGVTVGLLAGDYLQITIGSVNASGGQVTGGYSGTRVSWSYEGA